ncbi:MAG: hypothetical protein HQM13_12840 [SAR324 cluster bacterium]|nr:hypothetical protein [SAR324 cluster bacterium]
MGLNKLFKSGIALPKSNAEELEKSLNEGKAFFADYNEKRLELAFSTFSPDMKKALFEVIFFLHVNDPRFENIEYKGIKIERVSGIVRESFYQASANLYSPGTLHGVAGIDKLPATFREEFYEYTKNEFGVIPGKEMVSEFPPIVSISSLGSIGTISHKPQKSDLDLQILYELQPFKFQTEKWTEDRLKASFSKEINLGIHRLCVQQNLDPKSLSDNPKLHKELRQQSVLKAAKTYPYLYQILFQNKDFAKLLASPQGRQLKMNIILEMIQLITQSEKQSQADVLKEKERLLKNRILAIQDYIQTKFPKEEVYLFSCDCESFRQGHHGTTLESKEASGSAYELILNYDVLMPGIQFASTIPTHFIISKNFNNSSQFYARLINFIRFRCLPLYHHDDDYLVDMGATPSLKMSYMLTHIGAAYWESFKAASGNLPKALLNLLRIEVLYNSRYQLTFIELIKAPEMIDKLIPDNYREIAKEQEGDSKRIYGMSVLQVLELEQELLNLPRAIQLDLRIDPWWLKYKILKIFYSDPEVLLESSERRRISRNIDLCFALHIKLSDALAMFHPKTHRDRFLMAFLKKGFPPNSPQRLTIERFFMGEVQTINHFEQDLKNLFSNCLDRIHRIIALHDIPDGSSQSEFEIWYQYYQQNFEYAPNEIPKNILAHLKVPRASIRIRYEKSRRRGSWIFSGHAGKDQSSGMPGGARSDIPEVVDLTYDMSFLKGLTYCILNGYYGLLRAGSLQETKTKIDIDLGSADLGNVVDNLWCVVNSDTASLLMDRIVGFFPYRKSHYMDGVNFGKEVTEILFFMNLFKFGRISMLFRDNLQRWYVEEFDHSRIAIDAQKYYDNHQALLDHKDLHDSIQLFLMRYFINMGSKNLKTSFWYNYMSSGHAPGLDSRGREKSLSWQFQDKVLKIHGEKNYTNPKEADAQSELTKN